MLSFSSFNIADKKIEEVICNFKDEYFGYAIKFIAKGEKVSEFVTYLFKVFPDSFARIYRESNLNSNIIESLAYDALLHLNEDELKK